MTRKKAKEDKPQPRVSRSGRVVKRATPIYEVPHRIADSELARFTTRDKERLLACLRKFPAVQYQPLTVFRSVKCRSKDQIQRYLGRMRRKAAVHIEEIRRKQPPILTWFQVADEVTWLKEDEMLDQVIPTLIGIHVKEANTMQERNPILNFSNLYKYLRMLHKSETLPELTPAESVVLLDCFQQLADILRASETQPQEEFMQRQYRKYFQLLNFASSPMEGQYGSSRAHKRDESGFQKGATRPAAKTKAPGNQRPSVGPIMKAELRKKQPRRKTGKRTKVSKPQGEVESESPEAGENGSNQTAAVPSMEGDKTQESGEELDKNLTEVETEEMNGVHRTSEVGENGSEVCMPDPEKSSRTSGSDENDGVASVAGRKNSQSMNNGDAPSHNLDPNDPDFLSKFADTLSLGSLNPFDIPPDLLTFRPKVTARQATQPVTVGNIPDEAQIQKSAGDGTDIDLNEKDPKRTLDADTEWRLMQRETLDVSETSASTSDKSLNKTNDEINITNGKDSQGTEACMSNGEDCQGTEACMNNSKDSQVMETCMNTGKDSQEMDVCMNNGKDSQGTDTCVNNSKDSQGTEACTNTGKDSQEMDACMNNGKDSQGMDVCTNNESRLVSDCHTSLSCDQQPVDQQHVVDNASSIVVTNINQGALSCDPQPFVSIASPSVVTNVNQGASSPPSLKISQPATPSLNQLRVSSASQPTVGRGSSQQPASGYHQPAVLSVNIPGIVSGTCQPAVNNVTYHVIPGTNPPAVLSVNLPVLSNVNSYVVQNASQPTLMGSCQPVLMSSNQSVVASSCQPVAVSPSQPVVTSSCLPVIASSSQLVTANSSKPVIISSSQPVETSSSLTVIASSGQPVITSSRKPVVISSSQPVTINSCQPVIASSSQPVIVSSSQPVVISSSQPMTTNSCQPVITSSSQPVILNSSQSVVASFSQPVVPSFSQPVVTSPCQPVVTCSSQPAIVSAPQTLVSSANLPATTSAS